jgi:predicted nuclease of predicted toxin-antitoxin system
VKFLIDAQLSHKLAAWLIAHGHEAQAVREVGLRDADDSAIWRHALQTGAAILTKDEDFAARSAQAANAPVIVWLRVGNCSNEALRAWLEPRLPGIVQLVTQGSRLIEVI